MFNLEGIDYVALAVRDVPRAMQWYIDVLGFEHWHKDVWREPVFIGKGATAIALFTSRDDAPPPSSGPDHIGMLHLAFRATRLEFENAQRELKSRGIHFAFQDHQISHSIYFDDLDGNELEITTYEV